MCGIAGLLGELESDVAERAVDQMLAAQFHRGPDSGGLRLVQSRDAVACLGNRRLAIIDVSDAGRQPMVDEDTGNVLVYNGEIYNFAELRRDLAAYGVRFRGYSDTEVLLHGFRRWGMGVLDRLVGMFAFAVWDARERKLLLARDRLGIKPLYYAHAGKLFVFASEVRALLDSGLIQRRIDPVGVDSYLAYGSVQGPLTVVQGVESLPPAHWMCVEPERDPFKHRYWAIPFSSARTQRTGTADAVASVREILLKAVRRQLVSDVPVGLFLSGGVDSSALASLASAEGITPRTFSVTFGEEKFAEGAFAKAVAQRLGTDHTEIQLSERDLLSALPDAMGALDQPTHDGVNVFVVSRAAREAGVTVALSGQGGDELFAGYSTFTEIPRLVHRGALTHLLSRPAALAMGLGAHFSARLASSLRLQFLAANGDSLGLYGAYRNVFAVPLRESLLGVRSAGLVDGLPADLAAELDKALRPLSMVDRVSLMELTVYLGNTLLRDGDFMSMANSIEVRVPLLDDELVELVASIPGAQKMDPSIPKPLLVRAVGDRLPADTYTRPKQGFTFPWDKWLRGELREAISSVLDDRGAGESIGLRPSSCRDVWRSFVEGRRITTWTMVWTLFVLLTWCETNGVTI